MWQCVQRFIRHLNKSFRSFCGYQTAYFKCFPFFSSRSLFRLLLAALFPLQHRRTIVLPRKQAGGQLIVYTKKKKSGCSPKPSYCIQKATWEHLLGSLIHTGQAVVAQWTLYMMRGHSRRERHGCVQRWPRSCGGKQKQAQIIQVSFLTAKESETVFW